MIKTLFGLLSLSCILSLCACNSKEQTPPVGQQHNDTAAQVKEETESLPASIYVDTLDYQQKLQALANGDTTGRWPVKSKAYPLKGAILPYKRIVSYYGNLYSRQMGILGEYPPKVVWEKLNAEIDLWTKADSTTPVQPALHYIAVVAQATAMRNKTYCLRMPNSQIDSVLAIAKMGNAIVFLDVQLGQSTVENEIPRLEKYLKMPNVHLGLDPEFAMKDGNIPGRKMGTVDASEINFCTQYLADLVKKHNLTPKVFVVHRFTQAMVKNYKDILLHSEVQIVMDMDGWGGIPFKLETYRSYIYKQPVQFAGFKLFYKNDILNKSYHMLRPDELMKLKPLPVYIQYQ